MNRLLFNDGVPIYSKDWEKQFDSVEEILATTVRYAFEGTENVGGVIAGYTFQINADNSIAFDIVHEATNPIEKIGVAIDRNGDLLVSTSSGVVGLELSDLTIGVANVVGIKLSSIDTGLDPSTGLPTTTKRVSASTYQAHDVFRTEGISANVYSLTEWYALDESDRKDHVEIGRVTRVSDTGITFSYADTVYLGAKLGLGTVQDKHVHATADINPTKIDNVTLIEDPENSGIFREDQDADDDFFATDGSRTYPQNLEEFLSKIITQIRKIIGSGFNWDIEAPPTLESVNPALQRFRRSGTLPNELNDFAITISEETYADIGNGAGAKIKIASGLNLTFGILTIKTVEQEVTIDPPDTLVVGIKQAQNGLGIPIGSTSEYGEYIFPGNLETPWASKMEENSIQLAYSSIVSGTIEIVSSFPEPPLSNIENFLENPTPDEFHPVDNRTPGDARIYTSTGTIWRVLTSFEDNEKKYSIKYTAYLSRWDLLYFDPDPLQRKFRIIKGEPADDPVKPHIPVGSSFLALKYIFIDKYAVEKYENKLISSNVVNYETTVKSLPYRETAITSSTGVTATDEELGKLTFFSGYTLEPLIEASSTNYLKSLGLLLTLSGVTVLNGGDDTEGGIEVPTPEQDISSLVTPFGTSLVQGLDVAGVSDWVTAGRRKTTDKYANTFAGIRLFLGNEDDVYVLADSGPGFDDISVVIESSTGQVEGKTILRTTTDQTSYLKVPGTSGTGSFLAGYYTLSFRKATNDSAPITILKVIWGQINFEAEIGEFESLLVRREFETGLIANYIRMSVGANKQLILGDAGTNVDVVIPGDLTVAGSTNSTTQNELNVGTPTFRLNTGVINPQDSSMEASRTVPTPDAAIWTDVTAIQTSSGVRDWLEVSDVTGFTIGDSIQVIEVVAGSLGDTVNANYYDILDIDVGAKEFKVYDHITEEGQPISTEEPPTLSDVRVYKMFNSEIRWDQGEGRWYAGIKGTSDSQLIAIEGKASASDITTKNSKNIISSQHLRSTSSVYTGGSFGSPNERLDNLGNLKNINDIFSSGVTTITGTGSKIEVSDSSSEVSFRGTTIFGSPTPTAGTGGTLTPFDADTFVTLTSLVDSTYGALLTTPYRGITFDGEIIAARTWNAAFNDYADWQKLAEKESKIPGKAYFDTLEGAKICNKRCQKSVIGIYSDTFGTSVGKTGEDCLPISIGGWVLVYIDKKYEPGTCLVNDSKGNLTKARWFEKILFPERIVGIYKCKEKESIWGPDKVKVNGRHWVKVR